MDQTAAASNPDERPIRPAASSWEERPIRPAASASWDEQPIRPPENCASSTAAPPAENTNPHTAVLRPDDRYTIAALNYNGARVPFSSRYSVLLSDSVPPGRCTWPKYHGRGPLTTNMNMCV